VPPTPFPPTPPAAAADDVAASLARAAVRMEGGDPASSRKALAPAPAPVASTSDAAPLLCRSKEEAEEHPAADAAVVRAAARALTSAEGDFLSGSFIRREKNDAVASRGADAASGGTPEAWSGQETGQGRRTNERNERKKQATVPVSAMENVCD
jgi:hypothetical protein